MKKSWILGGAVVGCVMGASLVACGSSNSTTAASTGSTAHGSSSGSSVTAGSSAGSAHTSAAGSTGSTSSGAGGATTTTSTSGAASTSGSTSSGEPSDGGAPDASQATTTIAAARTGNVTTSITVAAVVTGVQGPSGDEVYYYIEDPAGGPNSGVVVWCDPAKSHCPAEPKAANPSVGDYALITGSISTYKGQLQFEPTNYTKLQSNYPLPTPVAVTGADVAASNTNAQYRGVLVKLSETLTVTNPTPIALYDSQCDAGAVTSCSGCAPPTYSGFQTSDSASNVIYVEQFFFPGDPLQSSPECIDAGGQVAVTQGETFPFMEGILDYDGYASAQYLAPRGPSDY